MKFKNRLFTLLLILAIACGSLNMNPLVAEAAVQNVNVGANAAQKRQINLARWLGTCNYMLGNMKRYKFRYSNRGGASTYGGALRKSRRTNCALFVSWCLQEYGAINKGNTFYMRGSRMHRNFRSWGGRVNVIRVGKRCSKTKLQPGDVVCWSSASHVNIYAGRSSSGKKLWYDGGKVATSSNRNGARYVHTGARHFGYLDGRKIAYIIRIKF